jgi:hypothetical protein
VFCVGVIVIGAVVVSLVCDYVGVILVGVVCVGMIVGWCAACVVVKKHDCATQHGPVKDTYVLSAFRCC